MERTIRVTEKGKLSVKPDMIRLRLNLEETQPDYESALKMSTEFTEMLKDIFENLGFERSSLALFHELGHVLQQRVKVLLVSEKNKAGLETNALIQKLETEADLFSQDILIPKDEYLEFIEDNQRGFTSDSVRAFAKKINILPGIVVGRLQQDKYLTYQTNLNSLKIKYVIS